VFTSPFLRSFFARHSLVRGFLAGLAGAAAVWLIPSHLSVPSRAIIAWDFGLVVFFVSLWLLMRCQTSKSMRAWAIKLQESRGAALTATLVAAVFALITVFVEMKLAKADHGPTQGVRIALSIVTVALSWFLAQTAFALDYAHEFYAEGDEGADRGGLRFPGGEAPDFWDFLHFSVIIGAAAQTADIEITSKPIRRLVTVHSLIAFSFNAVILALTINLTAGLLG
jgi:uncharacterized membrane protein